MAQSCDSLVSDHEEARTHHCSWMSTIPGLYGARLGQLVWPGTHDSGAFCKDFDYTKVVSGDKLRRYGTHLLNYSWQGARQFVSKWTQTQSLTVYEQLVHGVRYLDLRVSKCPSNGRYYIVHSFCGPSLEEVLEQICHFVTENKQEVLLVEVVPLDFVDHLELHALFGQKLGDLVFKRETNTSVCPLSFTLSHLVCNGRILLLYRCPSFMANAVDAHFFWDCSCLHAPFIESLDPSAKESFQLEHFEHFCTSSESQQHTKMFHFMYALTPSLTEIVGSLFRQHYPGNLQECAGQINPRLKQFTEGIAANWQEFTTMGVVVSVDYVQESELVQLAVEMNRIRFDSHKH